MKKVIQQLIIFSATFVLLLSLSGCPDKNDDDPVPFDSNVLVGDWKLTALTASNASTQNDVYDDLPACITDNIFRFTSSGTFTEVEGATKCDPGDPDTADEGTWMIQGAEFSYTDKHQATAFFMIITLSQTTFTVSQETDFLGQRVTLTATYTKQ
jgi:hypothetical protein